MWWWVCLDIGVGNIWVFKILELSKSSLLSFVKKSSKDIFWYSSGIGIGIGIELHPSIDIVIGIKVHSNIGISINIALNPGVYCLLKKLVSGISVEKNLGYRYRLNIAGKLVSV